MNLDLIAIHVISLGRPCRVRGGLLRVDSTARDCGWLGVSIPHTDADPRAVAIAVVEAVLEAETEVCVGAA